MSSLIQLPPETPVAFAQVIPKTEELDRDFMRGDAAYVRLDNSVALARISKEGKILRKGHGRQGLLETGTETLWGDLTPRIHHPLSYPVKNHRVERMRGSDKMIIDVSVLGVALVYFLVRLVLQIERNFSKNKS